MAYLKITRYGCRPLGYGPLVVDGESVLAWKHIATGRRIFTCPDVPGFGWRIEGDSFESFSSSLRAAVLRLERIAGHSSVVADPRSGELGSCSNDPAKRTPAVV